MSGPSRRSPPVSGVGREVRVADARLAVVKSMRTSDFSISAAASHDTVSAIGCRLSIPARDALRRNAGTSKRAAYLDIGFSPRNSRIRRPIRPQHPPRRSSCSNSLANCHASSSNTPVKPREISKPRKLNILSSLQESVYTGRAETKANPVVPNRCLNSVPCVRISLRSHVPVD